MTLPDQKNLHPFFDQTRNEQKKKALPEKKLAEQNIPQTETEDILNKVEHISEKSTTKTGAVPLCEGQVVKRGRKKKFPELPLEKGEKEQEDRGIQEDKSLSFAKQHETSPVGGAVGATVDNLHDSKRRRLSPPEQSRSWFDQLQRVAKGNRPQRAPTPLATTVAPNPSDCVEQSEPLGSSDHSGSQIVLNSTDINTTRRDAQLTTDGGESSAAPLKLAGDARSPPHILRLDGQGGFGFSSSKKKLEVEVPQEVPQPSRRGRKRRRLIIQLRYGTVDIEQRALIAHKIEQILGGSISMTGKPTKDKVLPVPAMELQESTRSHRTTHPFFLGKVQPTNPRDQTSTEVPTDSNAISTHNQVSFFKSFTTPGKLRSQALSKMDDEGQDDDQRYFHRSISTFRLPGTVEPAWPPQNYSRVCPILDRKPEESFSRRSLSKFHCRKEKTKPSYIKLEEQTLLDLTRMQSPSARTVLNTKQSWRPERLILTGHEIQLKIKDQLQCRRPGVYRISKRPSRSKVGENELWHIPDMSHPALSRIFNNISSAIGYFDTGGHETQAWTQKYAPQCAVDLLQTGKEPLALRDWLASHTIFQIEGQIPQADHMDQKTKMKHVPESEKPRKRRKRQKRSDELDGFIVSSDEETTDMHTLDGTDSLLLGGMPRSLIRELDQGTTTRQANSILLSGPHGCGKTAAAYAVAKELGFEVFEISPGSRRSGRDILDKVGDMTLNHQVRKAEQKTTDPEVVDESLPTELEEQQSTLNSFFTAAKPKKKPTKLMTKEKPKQIQQAEKRIAQASRQKQSLILLEEVDVLYDEDKQFWETVLNLAVQSKRPIILTCNDESLVPLNALSLHAILRFRPPPAALAEDYLILLAAAEGHLLHRESVSTLYRSRNSDLRGSIMDLNFWCQMAVGDPKRGINWFLERWPPGTDLDEHGRKLRVVSNYTYQASLNVFGKLPTSPEGFPEDDEDLMRAAWTEWRVEPSSISEQTLNIPAAWDVDYNERITSRDGYALLVDYERCLGLCSSADVFSTVDLPYVSQLHEKIDPTQPPVPAKRLADYVQGYPLLEADAATYFPQLDTKLAINTHSEVKHFFESQLPIYDPAFESRDPVLTVREIMTEQITTARKSIQPFLSLTRVDFSAAFDPIAEPSSTTSAVSNIYPLLYSSSFDRPFSIITHDLAPYVRSIVSFDMALEQQRQCLADLLSNTDDKQKSRSSKRLRTTRASRSALEGSSRAITRRERWFEAKTLEPSIVMRTAGLDWPRGTSVGGASSEGEMSRASSVDLLTT